ncbi:MAG: hypothetical protein ABH889_02245 [Candidatus Portnoybacteria bacterium]
MNSSVVVALELVPDKNIVVEIGGIEYKVEFEEYDFVGTTERCPDCGASMVTDQIDEDTIKEVIDQSEMSLVELGGSLAKKILEMANEQLYRNHFHCPFCSES